MNGWTEKASKKRKAPMNKPIVFFGVVFNLLAKKTGTVMKKIEKHNPCHQSGEKTSTTKCVIIFI
jgi:hypothetical protein